MKIEARHLSKRFNSQTVLNKISFQVCQGECMAITGANGSGKTTLMRIIAGMEPYDSGTLHYHIFPPQIKDPKQALRDKISFVGPYLELYQDLTAIDNLRFFAGLMKINNVETKITHVLDHLGLSGNGEKDVKSYSSGMKQRLKYALALLKDPYVLMVDEPRSNLDEAGVKIVYDIFERQKKDKLLIIATNDLDDLQFADLTVGVQ
jgi:heme exporter protein A